VFVPPDAGEVRRTCTFRMNAPAILGPGWTFVAPITAQDPRRVPEKFLLDPLAWYAWTTHAWVFGIVVGES